MEHRMVDVVVVGAGLSGLVAAYRLHQAGVSVALIEQGATPGGVIQSIEEQHYLLEAGPHTFQNSGAEIMALCQALNLTPKAASPEANKRYLYLKGKLQALPMNPLQILSTPLLSWPAKVSVMMEPWKKNKAAHEDETVADFVRRRFGKEVLDHLVTPFLSGVYAGDPEHLSIQCVFPKLVAWEQEYGSVLRGVMQARKQKKDSAQTKASYQLMNFESGMATLPKALLASLPGSACWLNSTVNSVQYLGEMTSSNSTKKLPEKFASGLAKNRAKELTRYQTSISTSDGRQLCFESVAVVIATPADVTASLTTQCLPESIRQELNHVEYAPIALVHLAYPKRMIQHPMDGFGCLIPRHQKTRNHQDIKTLGAIWTSSLFPERAAKDEALFSCFVGGALHPDLPVQDDEALKNRVCHDLAVLFNQPESDFKQPLLAQVMRWSRAIPQYNVGHIQRLEKIANALSERPGLYLAGNYIGGVSMNDCVKQATGVAEALLSWHRNHHDTPALVSP